MRKIALSALILFLCGGLCLAAQATTVRFEVTSPGEPAQVNEMYFRDDVLRMQPGAGDDEENITIIYRGDKELMWLINEDERSYIQMDKETMARLGKQVSGALAQLEAQLAQLPPEQRAAMEKMLKGRLPQTPTAKETTELRDTGETRRVNGYPCVKYEFYRGGRLESEIWATDASNLEAAHNLTTVLAGMADFYSELIESIPAAAQSDFDFAGVGELNRFPIRIRKFADRRVESEINMKQIGVKDVSDSLFEVDPSYKRRQIGPPGR